VDARIVNGSLNPKPKHVQRRDAPPCAPEALGLVEDDELAMRAKAIVASARYNPWSRSAGNAMSNPLAPRPPPRRADPKGSHC